MLIQYNDSPYVRYYHPAEAAACLGWPNWIALPASLDQAWKIVGNGLSTAHAMMGFIQTHIILGDHSPFRNVPGIVEALEKMKLNAINFNNFDIALGDSMFFVPKDSVRHLTPQRHDPMGIESRFNDVTLTRPDTPDDTGTCRKRMIDHDHHISPTVPFEIDLDGVLRRNDVGQNFKKMRMSIPDNQMLMVFLCSAIVNKSFDEPVSNPIPFVISCVSRRWVRVGWVRASPTVEDVVREVLPHSKSEHFQTLGITNQDVRFDHVIPGDKVIVKFTPTQSKICIQIANRDLWNTSVDVTTQIFEVVARLAFDLEVSPSDIIMSWKGRKVHDHEYFLAFSDLLFQAFWQPRVHMVPRCVLEVFEEKVSEDSMSMGLLVHNDCRVVAVHPLWRTIRTSMIPCQSTVAGVVEILFPDIIRDANPVGFAKGRHIPGEALIDDFLKLGRIEIDFQAKKPLPVCILEFGEVANLYAIDEHFEAKGQGQRLVSRWIRSPFKSRPVHYKLPASMTLAECGASFLANCEGNRTILCLSNGISINPMMECQHTTHDETITFRICALPGGAKHEDVKRMLSEVLKNKGVPDSDVVARVNAVLAKIDPVECKTALQADDFWDKLKGLANKNKVRLITHAELKAFQKSARSKSVEDKGQNQKAHPSKEKLQSPYQSQIDLNTIKVDLSHFRCEGRQVPSISIGEFGVDKHGICVMSNQQAEKYTTDSLMSVGGLAILAVGYPAIRGHTLLHIPATKINGNALVIPATLINCGEQHIEYVSQVKDIKLSETKSSVLEFVIDKATTKDWNLTQSTLHHLGSLFPELRDGKVLNTWSVKSFDENRKPCPHPKAAYTHGFMRITDDVLESALARSGKGGAFLTVKDESKKFDPRFAAVPLSPCSIEDANAQAAKCRFALGVVKLRQGFAIRCRKENLQETRQFVNPDGLYVTAGQIGSEDKLWILTRLSVSTTHDALSKGLQSLGWDARAVRQTSSQSWIIASKDDPPMRHVRFNGQVATITPKAPLHTMSEDVVCSVTPISEDAMSDTSTTVSGGAPVVVGSRIEDLRKELQEQMDKRLEETKIHLQRVELKIQQNDESMESFKKTTETELHGIRLEQTNIANTVQSNSAAILSEMATMLRNMQKESEHSMQALHAHFDKVVAGKHADEAEIKRPRQV